MSLHQTGDLDLDRNLDFQRTQWRVERVGWVVLAVVILLAILGLFGSGPLSAATAGGDASGITVDYQRFVRQGGQGELTVSVDGRHIVDGQVTLTIDGAWLEAVAVGDIHPEPVEVRGDGNDLVYVFAVAEGATSLEVDLAYVPQEMGRTRGRLQIGETTVTFTQFTYP